MARNRAEDPTHEADNREQDDAPSQAHPLLTTLWDGTAGDPSQDSERGGATDPSQLTPDDVPDLVDTMDQMVSSGRIDMGAYLGEPAHDDEPDSYGADAGEQGDAAPGLGDS